MPCWLKPGIVSMATWPHGWKGLWWRCPLAEPIDNTGASSGFTSVLARDKWRCFSFEFQIRLVAFYFRRLLFRVRVDATTDGATVAPPRLDFQGDCRFDLVPSSVWFLFSWIFSLNILILSNRFGNCRLLFWLEMLNLFQSFLGHFFFFGSYYYFNDNDYYFFPFFS